MIESERNSVLAPPPPPSAKRRRARRRRISGEGRHRTRAELAALTGLGLHLTLAPMLLGGVLPWGVLCIAVASLGCLALAAFAYRRELRAPAPPVLWAALGLIAYTAVQALPLPCGFVDVLAPGSARNTYAAQAALGVTAGFSCTLSADPGATQEEIVKGIAIVATLAAAWLLGAHGGRRAVFWMVALSTLAMSVVALGHGLAGLDEVFGIYKPVEVGRQLLLAPLMNQNNLGAFAALGVPLWIGLSYRTQVREVRWVSRLAVVLTALTAILSLSRGAVGQLVLGALLAVACVQLVSRSRQRQRAARSWWTRTLGIALTIMAAGAVAMYVDGKLVTRELENADLSKLGLLQRGAAFAWNHAWLGIGRGAFSSAFVGVEGQTVRFGYAENFLIQWASEWGLPITLAWTAVVVIALVRTARRTRSLAHLCAGSALLAFCAQNLVDLGFELVGIAVVAAALLAATIAPKKLDDSKTLRGRSLLIPIAALCTAGVVVLATLGPRLPSQSISALDARLREQLRVRDRAGFQRTLARSLSLHPAEPLFAVIAASEALTRSDHRAGAWINHAMQRAPNWAAPHALAFQWLWSVGQREQALVELRQAAEIDPRPWQAQICSLAGRKGNPALLASPQGAWRAVYLEAATLCLQPTHPSAQAIDEVLIREFPDRPLAFERKAYRLASEGQIDEGLATLNALLKRQPGNPRARATRVDMLLTAGRFQETVEQAERDLPLAAAHHKLRILRAEGTAYARLGDAAGAQRVILSYRSQSAGSVQGLAESYAFEAEIQLVLENLNSALAAYREAYSINQETSYLVQVASLAGVLGDRAQMAWAYVQLCAREPLTASYCATRDRILAPRARDVR
jgi:tetratricopeptide (TPR) repeat protein